MKAVAAQTTPLITPPSPPSTRRFTVIINFLHQHSSSIQQAVIAVIVITITYIAIKFFSKPKQIQSKTTTTDKTKTPKKQIIKISPKPPQPKTKTEPKMKPEAQTENSHARKMQKYYLYLLNQGKQLKKATPDAESLKRIILYEQELLSVQQNILQSPVYYPATLEQKKLMEISTLLYNLQTTQTISAFMKATRLAKEAENLTHNICTFHLQKLIDKEKEKPSLLTSEQAHDVLHQVINIHRELKKATLPHAVVVYAIPCAMLEGLVFIIQGAVDNKNLPPPSASFVALSKEFEKKYPQWQQELDEAKTMETTDFDKKRWELGCKHTDLLVKMCKARLGVA